MRRRRASGATITPLPRAAGFCPRASTRVWGVQGSVPAFDKRVEKQRSSSWISLLPTETHFPPPLLFFGIYVRTGISFLAVCIYLVRIFIFVKPKRFFSFSCQEGLTPGTPSTESLPNNSCCCSELPGSNTCTWYDTLTGIKLPDNDGGIR